MASQGYIDSLLSGLSPDVRRIVQKALEHLASSLKFGQPEHRTKARNFGGAFLTTTTPGVANAEFVLPHGLANAPYLLIPVLPVGEAGAKVVNLTVTRAADARFLYLSSPEVDTVVWVYVEGS